MHRANDGGRRVEGLEKDIRLAKAGNEQAFAGQMTWETTGAKGCRLCVRDKGRTRQGGKREHEKSLLSWGLPGPMEAKGWK